MKLLLCAALLCVAPLVAFAGGSRSRRFATRAEAMARHGMAATSQPLATRAAVSTLERGGSAVDAAIAANAVLGVVEPTGGGVGGDLFAIVWDAKARSLTGLNASGRSPLGLTREELTRRGLARIPTLGPLSVSVPGAVDGWCRLHERWGRLSLRELLAPAIDCARYGFAVTEVIAAAWASGADARRRYPGFSEVFLPDERAPAPLETFRNPALAATLEAIAAGGRDAFYSGPIARAIDDFMRAHGGFVRTADLAAHTSTWVEPISTEYRGYRVWQLPPNGQGLTALQMLNILEGYDLASLGFGSVDYVHLLVEAKKLAFEDRARFYGDPAFSQMPIEPLLSKAYAARRRALIDPAHAALTYPPGNLDLEAGDTVYLSVADRDANMVSLIQSNYMGHGSGLTPPTLGFCFQNRGTLFTLADDHPNGYAPGKRPFHTIMPGFVTREGEPLLSFGVMGGDMQPQGQVEVLVNLIDFGMSLQAAGDAPRIRHFGSSQPTGSTMRDGGTLTLEPGFADGFVEALRRRGHQVRIRPNGYGGYQAVGLDAANRLFYGASESRKDGYAAGC